MTGGGVVDGRLRIPTAEVFAPLLAPARYKGARGGRASAKSHFFASCVVDYMLSYPGLRAACVREVQKSLKFSSKLLIQDKVEEYGLGGNFRFLDNEIRCVNGSFAIFIGMSDQTAESMKSLEGFDVFWFEEAQAASATSLGKLRPTVRRTPRSRISPEMWFSWNPTNKDDAVELLLGGAGLPPGAAVVSSSFRDNPWLPEELAPEIEWDRRRDPEKYQHVWEGGYLLRSDARVFSNWTIDEFDTPRDAVFYFGADWGFSVDPTVLVRCFIDHDGRRLFVDREAYKVGCEIDQTPALFDGLDPGDEGMARGWTITADSARPDTISYMRNHGYPHIESARKGPGSLEDGVEFLKSYDIVVHPSCRHTADELTFYSYKVDRHTEKVLPVLEDRENHVIDSLRYAVESVRRTVRGRAEAQEGRVVREYDAPIAVEMPETGEGLTGSYDGGLT